MKVLFVSHHLKGNDGWSRYARDLILGIKSNGSEVVCLVNEIDRNTDIDQKLIIKKDPSAYLVSPIISYLNARLINNFITEFKPDIIHFIVEPYANMLPFLKFGSAKVVITAHSTFAYMPILLSGIKRKISEYLTKRIYKLSNNIISVSKYTEEHLIKHMKGIGAYNLIDGKIRIVSGGVSSSSIDSVPRNELNNNPKEILFVGAIKPRKGLLESIEALSKVKTNFIYRIVGSYSDNNPYVKLIKSRLNELSLQDKVIMVGSVSDSVLNEMYAKADLFLMLSTNNGADFEGYGLVYIEANGHGVPVIGPNDSGVSDAVIQGKTGYLVNQYDSDNVAKTIDNLLVNKTISSADCISWARDNTSEIKANMVFDIYNNLLKR